MDHRNEINRVRDELDRIDTELLQGFQQRMELVDQIADFKRKGNIAISDPNREQEIVDRSVEQGRPDYRGEVITFVRTLMGLSKFRQRKLLFDHREDALLPPAATRSTEDLTIAYQGTEGAWGEQAGLQLFPGAQKTGYSTFEEVFRVVKSKKAHYGVLPIENTKTGAIGEVYDLLRSYGCYIVGQTWVHSHHCLMGIPGTKLSEIREVLSHPEGFRQCDQFLKDKHWDLAPRRNTAVAAKAVAEKGNSRFAAIGSPRAAELYGLEVLAADIMDDRKNRTRFLAIAAAPEYDQTCDTVSITFRTAHRSGALCEVLFHFLSAGINLSRIESRPMLGEGFCFFADVEGNIEDETVMRGLRHAAASCGYLEVLGCYRSATDLL